MSSTTLGFAAEPRPTADAADNRECVVVLYGLARSSRSMSRLVERLCRRRIATSAARALTTVVLPPQSPLSYPYRDDRSLVDATTSVIAPASMRTRVLPSSPTT